MPSNNKNKKSDTPVLPYNGTSGWSGSGTSKKRAINADKSGITKTNQELALNIIKKARKTGRTYQEIDKQTKLGHGSVSGTLSILHKANKIKRLREERNGCKVYVLREFVGDRVTERPGYTYRNKKIIELLTTVEGLLEKRDTKQALTLIRKELKSRTKK